MSKGHLEKPKNLRTNYRGTDLNEGFPLEVEGNLYPVKRVTWGERKETRGGFSAQFPSELS